MIIVKDITRVDEKNKEVLISLFADTDADVIDNIPVVPLMRNLSYDPNNPPATIDDIVNRTYSDYKIAEGSSIMVADGGISFRKSNGSWQR